MSQIPALVLLLFYFFLQSSHLWPLLRFNGTENSMNLICAYVYTFSCHQPEVNDFFTIAPLRGSSKRQWKRESILVDRSLGGTLGSSIYGKEKTYYRDL